MHLRQLAGAFLAAVALPAVGFACMWDYDTLKQERARFPGALEIITGKFLRHSKEFYQWRIADRLKKLADEPSNLAYHDDLAVAYEMSGQHAKAVETILAKEAIKPGVYETYSNLGTFHILAGDFAQGLPFIDKALAINPDAHFGRERYQKWLVEHALAQRIEGKLSFPMQTSPDNDFARFVAGRLGKERLDLADVQSATKGVLGMMRFANHQNPLLLEALGDLLMRQGTYAQDDAKRLAARCYLKASQVVSDATSKAAFRKLAEEALKMQRSGPTHWVGILVTLEALESDFAKETADADTWYAALREREIGWIRDGKNADVEFDRLYTAEPSAHDLTPNDDGRPIPDAGVTYYTWSRDPAEMIGVAAVAVVLILALYIAARRFSRKA
jgi:tetratricopeptide (TPR) repeat protein